SALVQAFQKGDDFARMTPEAQFAWLRKAVGHLIVNAARNHRRGVRDVRREVPLPMQFESSARWEQMLASLQTSPSSAAERNEFNRQLAAVNAGAAPDNPVGELNLIRALARLDPAQRSAVVLKYVHDYSQAEVAKELGLNTAGQVAGILARGLTRLHELLTQEKRDE